MSRQTFTKQLAGLEPQISGIRDVMLSVEQVKCARKIHDLRRRQTDILEYYTIVIIGIPGSALSSSQLTLGNNVSHTHKQNMMCTWWTQQQ